MKYCHKCGAQVNEANRFCASCGQNLTVAAVAPASRAPVRDYARHVNVLGLLLIIWGVLGALRAAGVLLFAIPALHFMGRFVEHDFAFVGGFLPSILWGIGWFFAVVAVAAIVAGTGLRNYEPWARTLAIIVCILALFRIPFGTALGIYGLWTLLSAEGERHYRQAARLAANS